MDFDFSSREQSVRTYAAGEVIFEAGDRGGEMFLVLSGEVLITLQGAEIDRLKQGDILGEMALVEEAARSASATAAVESRLLCVDRDEFRHLVHDSPDFALKVMSIMSGRLRRFIDEEVKKQRLEEEMRIGREIQLSLIPRACPTLPGWSFAAAYKAAREVGGDFYDFVFVPEERDSMQLVIADVTGKGVPAALFMASCRTTMRAEAMRGMGPAETLRQANCVIALDTQYPLFLTALCARLHAASGAFTFANGGHERPLWLRAATGDVQTVMSHDPLLGFMEDAQYEEHTITVERGDFLVFFTDGVTEARDAHGDFYGDGRLHTLLKQQPWHSADELLKAILDSVAQFSGDSPQADDLTLIVAQRTNS
jgi:sigma-B regulation protein RsbU (phosphoserine phosphatase)